MYVTNPEKPYYYTVKTLTMFGHIPKDFKKLSLYCFCIYSFLMKLLFLILNVIAPSLHLIMPHDPRAVNISEDFAFVYGGVTEMVGITLVGIRWRRWSRLLHDITKDTEFGKDPNFGQLVKQLNRFSGGCTIYCTVMSVIYAMSGASDSARCKRMNEEEGLREICGTLSSVWLPFEVSEAASKIIYALQLVLFLYAITPAVATAVLVLETAELIVSHINNLNNHFIEAFDSPDKEEITKRFGFCVRYHKYVLEIATRFNLLVQYTCAITSVLSAVAFSVIANQAFNAKPLGTILYLIAYLVALFSLCHAGQRIKDETFLIKDAVYASKWYNSDAGVMRDVRFVIARSQIPVYLETFPLGCLDYPFFLLILKTAYTYLTLLRQAM